jgi:hypothetical protein
MIFVDESGSRWKKIKTFALAGTGLTALTLAVIVVGSLVTPQWGQISVLKQAEKAISSGQTAITTLTKPILASAPAPKKLSPKVTPMPNSTSSTATPSTVLGASTQTATATPRPANTPAPTSSPAPTPVPGNSEYGKLHNPK